MEPFYPHQLDRYTIHATAPLASQGRGVALVWRDNAGTFAIGLVKTIGNNVILCHLVFGNVWYLVVGTYILPSKVDSTTCKVTLQATEGSEFLVILMGDFNYNRRTALFHSPRDAQIASVVACLGEMTLFNSFKLEHWYHQGYTWHQQRADGICLACCNHIFTTSPADFKLLQVRQP